MASLATVVANMIKVVKPVKTNILKVLKPNSEVLENLTRDFHTMLLSREEAEIPGIKIVCFVEELPVSKAGKTFMVLLESPLRINSY